MRPDISIRGIGATRNSSIELLKILGIALIVVSHVVQTLCQSNDYVASQDYVLSLTSATTDPQMLALSMLRYSGIVGNTLFFTCSCWFLLDSGVSNKKKMLQMLMDVWVISVVLLTAVLILRGGMSLKA